MVFEEAIGTGLRTIDVEGVDRDAREASAFEGLVEEWRRPFDLANGPGLRAVLAEVSDQEPCSSS